MVEQQPVGGHDVVGAGVEGADLVGLEVDQQGEELGGGDDQTGQGKAPGWTHGKSSNLAQVWLIMHICTY